uniref:TIGR01212 family radical SAM protein n=1 Tax=Eubacterium cellulosolvens TaxID=29322 RepID=UPI0004813DB1|nr:TIGR01212 family radical SAM protein [[Eubacterium] cellulosolvens]
MEIRRLSDALKEQFGQKVYKLSLSAGCTCPNRDGRIGTGGCTFCSEGGSGDFAAAFRPIEEQIEEARKRVDAKIPASIPMDQRKYIAYFQSFTSTYGDTERLRGIFSGAVDREEIAGLSIGTRPDCLEDDKVEMLRELNARKPVWVELGLQTIHQETAERIHRGYRLEVFEDTYQRLKEAGLTVIVHVILGLPGESREMMLETVRYLASLTPELDGIKLQLLHVLRGTALAEEYEKEPFELFTPESYCATVVDCLKLLPEHTVIHRMTGDGPRKLLIAPLWSTDKKRVLNMLNAAIRDAERT